MRIAVVGLGHTGLVAAAAFAERGHQVVGHDIESEKRRGIQSGKSPFLEPGLDELLACGLASGRLVIVSTLDEGLSGAEIVVLAVGTPVANGDGPNLTEFWSATGQVVPLTPASAVLAIKSTIPVGTTDELILRFGAKWPGPAPVVTIPEFLRQGSAVQDFLHPDRVVLGSHSADALEIVRRAYEPFGIPAERVIECTPAEAELIKHATNAFLATKISFANQLANLCGKLNVDYQVVRNGLGMDPRVGSRFLDAGLGFGGSCFPKDVAALIQTAQQAGCPLTLLEAAFAANRRQIEHVANLARDMLGELQGKKILQLGLTYKAGTDDLRGSLAVELAFLLARAGAEVTCHDPAYKPWKVGSDRMFKLTDDPAEGASGADLIVVATDWPQFRDLPWPTLATSTRSPNLLDGRNLLDPHMLTEAGFTYRGVGRMGRRKTP